MPWFALSIYVALLAASWAAGVRLAKTGLQGLQIALAAGFAAAGSGFLAIFRPDIWVRIVPWRDGLFISNLFPIAVALVTPSLLLRLKTRPERFRFGVLAAVLFLLSLRETALLFKPPAASKLTWIDRDGVCRQTSRETCSAAALVTLLRHHGIDATEAEIVKLAWTRRDQGTTQLGLYRALSAKAGASGGVQATIEHIDADRLMALGEPAVITVGLGRLGNSKEAEEFGAAYEWSPGALHDVTFLGRSDTKPGHVKIGEPDFGLEEWPEEHLRYLYRGFALRLDTPQAGNRDRDVVRQKLPDK